MRYLRRAVTVERRWEADLTGHHFWSNCPRMPPSLFKSLYNIMRKQLKDKIQDLELKLVEEHEFHGHEVSSFAP